MYFGTGTTTASYTTTRDADDMVVSVLRSPSEIRLEFDNKTPDLYRYINTNDLGEISVNVHDIDYGRIWDDDNVVLTYGNDEKIYPICVDVCKHLQYHLDHPITDNPVIVVH